MADGETGANFNFGAIFRSATEKRADDSFLVSIAAERVVEDGENCLFVCLVSSSSFPQSLSGGSYLWLYHDIDRGSIGRSANSNGTQGPCEMNERTSVGHDEEYEQTF